MTELTAEMIVDALVPEEIRVSPDGSLVAFVATPASRKEEHPASAIWVARSDGASPPGKMTAGTARDHAPRWAPDGQSLHFLSDRVKRDCFQLYRISLGGGEAEALSDWEPGIDCPAPMPDGKSVAFLAVNPDSDEEKKRKEERDDAEVYGERWPRQRLRMLDLATREVTTIEALGERHIVEVAPSADGARVAVVAAATPELDTVLETPEIVVVDLAGDRATATSLCRPLAGAWDVAWGAGDRELLFAGFPRRGMRGAQAIYAVLAAGGEPRQVSPDLRACPDEFVTNLDGDLYVQMAEHLDSWIGRLDPDTRHIERLHDLPGNAWSLHVSARGETLAVGRGTRDDFANVWAGPAGGELRKLTDFNPDHGALALSAQDRLTWRAPDGLEIDGLLLLPPGAHRADGPFPLMTLVHGGPYGRFADELQIGWGHWGQWLATAGYAVLLPNPRGGPGARE